MYKKTQNSKILIVAISLFCIPIFLICFILPAYPQTSSDIAINQFLDEKMFGLIGFWSSLFPFSSKAAANYVAVAGPLLAAFSLFTAITFELDPIQLGKMTIKRYLATLIGGTLFFTVLSSTFYLSSYDLGTRTGKYGNLLGANVLFFSIHHALMSSLMFFITPFFIYSYFYPIPRFLIKRWLSKSREMKI